jgi:hypothetical protein
MKTPLRSTIAVSRLRFKHQPSWPHTGLVESVCSNCSSFVAASSRPEVLRFVEKLHLCGRNTVELQGSRPSA